MTSWCVAILVFSTAVSSVTAVQYVAHYNCNDGGLYFVSNSAWIGTDSSGAEARCTTAGATIVTMSDITGTCAQSYIAYITTLQKRSISVWISDGSGGVTCYPKVTPCPAGDVVMCKNIRADAVSPPSTHCGTDLSPVANGTLTYPSGDVFPSQAFLVCNLGYTKSSVNWYADCGGSGSWQLTTGPQMCNAIVCTAPIITNGLVTGTAPVFNVTCNANFGIVGSPTVTCTSVATTTTVPTCNPICPILNIPNANYSTANQLVGTNVNVTCNSGFEMFGPQTVTCQASQLWTTIPECEAIVCKTLPTINNGGATASSMTKYGVLHVHCNTGYKLSGMATSKCLSTGSWEIPIASCTEITCTSPTTAPANGAVTTGTNTLSSVLQYSCNEGYQLSGTSYTVCQADGSWSTANPMCTQITCPLATPPPVSGTVSSSANTYLSSRQYSCMTGYMLTGSTDTVCLSNGKWSGTQPTCSINICRILSAPTNGYVYVDDLTFGSKASFSCNVGYRLTGASSVTCLTSQSWSAISPTCTKITCPSPPAALTNGAVSSGTNTFSSVRQYSCMEGYQLSGTSYTICQGDGSWSTANPMCTQITCPSPPAALTNGTVSSGTNTFSAVRQYSCMEGYQLSGTSYTICQADGSWSTANPMCTQITCPMATPPPANGTVSSSANTYLSSRQYSCMTGYMLTGSTDTVCLSNGKWSGTQPTCSRILCPAPIPPVTNGGVEMGGTTYLTVRGFFCNPGKALSGSRYTVCQADGTWSTASPICTENICRTPLTPINGYVYIDDTTVGSKASFSCNAGYRLTGVSSVTCLTNQTWSAISPTCTNITCPVLATPPNAIVSAGPVDFQAKRTFSCSDGYTLSGDSQLVCLLNGSWSAPLPNCSRVPECPQLIVTNAVVSGGSTRVNGIRNITCNGGFELSGHSLVTCLPSGEWTTLPVCNRAPECPLLSVSNGIVSGGSNTVNSIRSITCNANFDLSGNSMVICLATAAWSSTPVCNLAECPMLTVSDAVLAGSSNTVTGVRNITCNAGFELSGNSMVTCLPGAVWSSTPSCNRVVQCGSLQVSNGKVSDGENTIGSVRTATCNLGYELGSDQTAVCLANGNWSSNPVCTVIATTVPPTVQGATEASSFFSQSGSVALIAVIAVLAVLLILAIVGIIVMRRQSPDRKGEMTVTFNNKGIDGEVATVSETPQLSKMPRSDPSGVSLYATPAKNSPAPQSKQDITYAAVEFGGGARKNTVVAPNPRTDDTTMYSDVTFKAPTS
ncbi:sushi, von Willebrand factor type A, EGF and pentraxin domain-containing protein 1-like isoform X2 [Sycon ciliatum]|uniref:sushi, von Willebrand factor type A, EGF and pentraxin domain-containing protein 1-like isoform X2 n=1 Tax=Sycon ciliatum TaxID=27933 RepID=UPI0031F6ED1A